MMQRLGAVALLTFLTAALASSQAGLVVTTSIPDVTGTGVTVQMIPAGGTARWVQLIPLAANSGKSRCGDSAVSATRGAELAAGGGFMEPPIYVSGDISKQPLYKLSAVYCYIPNGDKVSVLWAN